MRPSARTPACAVPQERQHIIWRADHASCLERHEANILSSLRDPTAGNQPLIMNVGAVWDVDPNKVKFAEAGRA